MIVLYSSSETSVTRKIKVWIEFRIVLTMLVRTKLPLPREQILRMKTHKALFRPTNFAKAYAIRLPGFRQHIGKLDK